MALRNESLDANVTRLRELENELERHRKLILSIETWPPGSMMSDNDSVGVVVTNDGVERIVVLWSDREQNGKKRLRPLREYCVWNLNYHSIDVVHV